MFIEYGGHACVRLGDENLSLIIDPFCNIGYKLDLSSADYCLCSHDHFDHNATHEVEIKKVINKNEYANFSWLSVLNCYHDEVLGAKRGENKIFIIQIDGFRICHFGDLGEPFNASLCEKIGKIDILFIPVGGKYTINAKESVKYVQKIAPKIVIPIHYKTARSSVDIASKEEFISYFTKIEKMPRKFELTNLSSGMAVFDIDDSNF